GLFGLRGFFEDGCFGSGLGLALRLGDNHGRGLFGLGNFRRLGLERRFGLRFGDNFRRFRLCFGGGFQLGFRFGFGDDFYRRFGFGLGKFHRLGWAFKALEDFTRLARLGGHDQRFTRPVVLNHDDDRRAGVSVGFDVEHAQFHAAGGQRLVGHEGEISRRFGRFGADLGIVGEDTDFARGGRRAGDDSRSIGLDPNQRERGHDGLGNAHGGFVGSGDFRLGNSSFRLVFGRRFGKGRDVLRRLTFGDL